MFCQWTGMGLFSSKKETKPETKLETKPEFAPGETLTRRVLALLDDGGKGEEEVTAAALASEGDVALFGHAHQLRILTARWLGLDASRGSNFVLDTASLSILSFEREQRVVSRWNELCPVRDVP